MPNPLSSGLPNPASYNTSTSGIVIDNVTGLIWQRQPTSAVYTLSGATNYCDALSLAGYTHWKVPTRIELISLLDQTRSSGAMIDSTAFPGTATAPYWSSTQKNVNGTNYAMAVDFEYGAASLNGPEESFYNVRCVH
jgi:hypothetical protein